MRLLILRFLSWVIIGCASVASVSAQAISIGKRHCAALDVGGKVHLWGDDKFNQLKIPKSIRPVIGISCGDYHTIAIQDDGTVVAWGRNDSRQCEVPPGLQNVQAVSAGAEFSLALMSDGTVVGWGRNGHGQINIPLGMDQIVSISAGKKHVLAINSSGQLVSWGSNRGRNALPRELETTTFKAVSAGDDFSVAITSSGGVVAWGYNEEGQCDVPWIENAVAIAAGQRHALALTETGDVISWGMDKRTIALGTDAFSLAVNAVALIKRKVDQKVTKDGPENYYDVVKLIDANADCSLALLETGELSCWGVEAGGRTEVPTGLNLYRRNQNSHSAKSYSSNGSTDEIRIRLAPLRKEIEKVAVIGVESTSCDNSIDDGKAIAGLIEAELLGVYSVVERGQLDKVLDEQKLALNGLVLSDSDYAQAGLLAGAQGTVLVSGGCLQGKSKFQIKLVDCSSAELQWTATGFDASAFDLMDALRFELNKAESSVNVVQTSEGLNEVPTAEEEENDVPIIKEEDEPNRTLSVGDIIQFYENESRLYYLEGEVIKIMNSGRLVVSFIDRAGKQQREYVEVEEVKWD